VLYCTAAAVGVVYRRPGAVVTVSEFGADYKYADSTELNRKISDRTNGRTNKRMAGRTNERDSLKT